MTNTTTTALRFMLLDGGPWAGGMLAADEGETFDLHVFERGGVVGFCKSHGRPTYPSGVRRVGVYAQCRECGYAKMHWTQYDNALFQFPGHTPRD